VSLARVKSSDHKAHKSAGEDTGLVSVSEPEIILVQAGRSSTRVRVATQDGLRIHEIASGATLMVACSHASLQCSGSDFAIIHMSVNPLCKVLAFLDGVDEIRNRGRPGSSMAVFPFDRFCLGRNKGLEYWFIHGILQENDQAESLAAFLRRLESYWLVRFLLSESSRLKSVGALGDEYGLSYSHFRRVCKIVLGSSVKSELKVWRAARSLLEAISGAGTMTEVAIRNGYASSSHFSTEIKKLFGRSPRAMTAMKN
jgi:AraC-like DNA-binding protein